MSSAQPRTPLAINIREAAEHVGLSRGQFYREFLQANPPRLKAIPGGKRARIVVLSELEAAFAKYIEEKRAPNTTTA
jgi:hypothetical protein